MPGMVCPSKSSPESDHERLALIIIYMHSLIHDNWENWSFEMGGFPLKALSVYAHTHSKIHAIQCLLFTGWENLTGRTTINMPSVC